MKPSKVVKIVTFCPKESADDVRVAIGKAGGGVIGKQGEIEKVALFPDFYHHINFVPDS